ncbi:MAG: aminotransferase class V-fold PLP-dependent enzyme, partial [Candidatus Komeilibacteria bacterium]
ISELVKIAKDINPEIVFHTDACQASPYLSLDVEELGVDLMTLNASKVYGPKGVGLLYIKKGTKIEPIIYGGGQEFDLRSGTENIPGIIGFVKALEIAQEKRVVESKRLIELRDKLINGLQNAIERVNLNGHPSKRLPNNINLTFEDIEGEAILLHLNEYGIMASTGSACASHSLDVSHVLKAIGLPYELIHGSIRFTMGVETTEEDIDQVVQAMVEIVEKLRAMSPVHLDQDQHPKVKSLKAKV